VRADRLRAALALLAVATVLAGCGRDGPRAATGRTVVIDVPRGSAARIADGEDLRVVPDRIVARVGDTLRLVNHDTATHMIGPFLVGPGQRVESRLARAGTYVGACTLHAGRRKVAIVVEPRR
jgi:plastocyanin